MNVSQSDLVLLPYPFSDLEGTKVRPALVISNNSFNKKSDDCIMVPLTTVIKDEPYSICIYNEDLLQGKLLKPSRIRVDKIFTVQKDLIRMKIGSVSASTLDKVKKEIMKVF